MPPLTMKTIQNADQTEAEILVYGDIGGYWGEGITAKGFADELKALGKLSVINLRINSGGGDVFEGLAIYNTLRAHSARKVVTVDGLAASIASVIAMAGDTVRMAENAMMMIHDPWCGVMGSADELRKTASTLDAIKDQLITTYSSKSGRGYDRLWEMMSAETWMSAKEAKDLKLCDEIIDRSGVAAKLDRGRYKNAPKDFGEASAATSKLRLAKAILELAKVTE